MATTEIKCVMIPKYILEALIENDMTVKRKGEYYYNGCLLIISKEIK